MPSHRPISARLRRMPDRLEVVAVGIERERAVVAARVLRTEAGRTVVAPAGGERGGVERVDLLARRGAEGDVRGAPGAIAIGDREVVRAVVVAERDLALGLAPRPSFGEAEGRQRLRVEAPAAREVGHRDGDVVEHRGAYAIFSRRV